MTKAEGKRTHLANEQHTAGPKLELHFDAGTLVAPSCPADDALQGLLPWDARTGTHRAPAHRYAEIRERALALGVPLDDRAAAFSPLEVALTHPFSPFPHQAQALAAWIAAECRGVIELPTGAGKTLLAVLAIAHVQGPTLIVVPTLDLMQQWKEVLSRHLSVEVGCIGGGLNEPRAVTVVTYDSAAFRTEFHGNRYALLICDECHHLPAPRYQFIAEGSLAPARLGLTATLARADGGERICEALLGPLVHRTEIGALQGAFLAPYEVHRIEVPLTDDEQRRYATSRSRYLGFLRKSGISFSSPSGWAQFVTRSQRTEEGREAFAAYREQRRIALTSRAKLEVLWGLLRKHRDERVLVFTDDNETVYTLAHRLLVPALTHQTPLSERRALLAGFSDGSLPVLLTSKVLNEGVDVPTASVAVVLSGSGSVREHVQRLGRILRKVEGKRAVLYEVCSAHTTESAISDRRRQHGAYRPPPPEAP